MHNYRLIVTCSDLRSGIIKHGACKRIPQTACFIYMSKDSSNASLLDNSEEAFLCRQKLNPSKRQTGSQAVAIISNKCMHSLKTS